MPAPAGGAGRGVAGLGWFSCARVRHAFLYVGGHIIPRYVDPFVAGLRLLLLYQ